MISFVEEVCTSTSLTLGAHEKLCTTMLYVCIPFLNDCHDIELFKIFYWAINEILA